ncbi:MAG: GAF domain-containing protein, partial [Armatimonadota bacterium]
MRRVGQAINLRSDLPQMLSDVADIIKHVTNTDVCLIYLLNDARNELSLRAASQSAEEAVGKVRIPLGVGITGWVAMNRYRVAITSDAASDARFISAPEIKQDQFESMLSVPLLGQDEVIGVVNVRTAEEHDYNESQIEMLESVAELLGSAVETSTHLQHAQRRASQLSTLSEISRTISSKLYLE